MAMMVVMVFAGAFDAAAQQPASHLRPVDRYARWIIESAQQRSATVRELTERLDASDTIAYVRVGTVSTRTATTTLLDGDGSMRYVLISLHQHHSPAMLMELLGHELQHANEIADAREVRDETGMARLYRRIGMSLMSFGQFETVAAQTVGRRVRRELAGALDGALARRER
jgi:hypothetical protein